MGSVGWGVIGTKSMNEKRTAMSQLLWVAGFVVVWFLLQVWILPKLGVST